MRALVVARAAVEHIARWRGFQATPDLAGSLNNLAAFSCRQWSDVVRR